MIKERKEKITGFTLIEVIIYLALFSIIIGGAMAGVYQLIQSSDANAQKIIVEQEGNFLLRKIDWALSNVASVSVPSEGASGQTLKIDKVNYTQNPIEFNLAGSNLELKKGGGSAVALNSSYTVLSDLLFEHLPPSGAKPAAIKTSFKLNGQSFTTTKYFRK